MKAVPILILGAALAAAGAGVAGAQDRYGYQSSEPYAVRTAAAWRGGGGGGGDGGGSAVVYGHVDPRSGTCMPDDGYGPPPSGPFCECPPTEVYEAPFYTGYSHAVTVHVRAPGIRIVGRPIDVPGSVIYVQGPPVWVDAPPVHVGPSQIYIQAPDVHVNPSDVTVAPPDVHFTPAPPPHTPTPCPDCTPSGHY